MIWRDGVVPEEVPEPLRAASLTANLLDFGYGVLALALELRDANRDRASGEQFPTTEGFRVAAEAIESAVRRGDPTNGDQGRHLVVSAAAFHLAGYAARAFSLLSLAALDRNLASHERCLAYLLRRDLLVLRSQIIQWHSDPTHTDEAVSVRLLDAEDAFGAEDAAVLALTTSYHRGLGLADTGLQSGDRAIFDDARQILEAVVDSAAQIGNVPTWWATTLTVHLLRDLWDQSLHVLLPSGPNITAPARWGDLRRDFVAQLGARKPPQIELWPSQIAAAKRSVDPRHIDDSLLIGKRSEDTQLRNSGFACAGWQAASCAVRSGRARASKNLYSIGCYRYVAVRSQRRDGDRRADPRERGHCGCNTGKARFRSSSGPNGA